MLEHELVPGLTAAPDSLNRDHSSNEPHVFLVTPLLVQMGGPPKSLDEQDGSYFALFVRFVPQLHLVALVVGTDLGDCTVLSQHFVVG